MGLRDWLRGKPEQDPILGGLEQASAEAHTQVVARSVETPGVEGYDAAELARRLQSAGGDPDRIVAELRALFPGAQIDVSESTVRSSFDPELAAQMLGSFAPQSAPADPIGQLERLAALRASGALTEAEFAAAKARLLG
jgi:hypothetical protein